jgi:predicted DCC family thiol-disulfide oxidoreductase YuxK
MSKQSKSGADNHLYAVTVGCPCCDGVSQFVVKTDGEVGLMQDVPLYKDHCPYCGVRVDRVGEWDRHAEHEVMVVSGDRTATTGTDQEGSR